MAPRRRRRRRRPWYRTRAYRLTRTVVLTAALVTGCVHWTQDEEPPGPAAAGPGGSARAAGEVPGDPADGAGPLAAPRRQDGDSRPRSAPSPGEARATPSAAVPPPLPYARAVRLLIPYLSVDAPVMDLRLDDRRRLPAPAENDAHRVGWYADGPGPGGRGTAVAVGHLDTDNGPAVFAGLSELRRGKLIEVRRADGRTAVYAVDALRKFEKAHFPNGEVYGDRGRPELRLITCGGTFHRRTGYDGNLVVFAHFTRVLGPDPRPAPT
ncbi:class F sortase [Streptomyces sp. DSM 15324]|uniref:class F sortase n=1 Tax=Streptomyces sp. DSM 15324 TaxID=1739111 RepID=UPI000747A397|nr:class F sortase [Streptomyces sp. DSM 15324]KUO11118.1 hypothetical protein AQJ58_16390 [Streptomyces sp. DSM 15324]